MRRKIMKRLAVIFMGLFYALSSYAFSYIKITKIEPLESGTKITYELGKRVYYKSEGEIHGEIQNETFAAHDDDGSLSLSLLYRVLTNDINTEEWEQQKNQKVPHWDLAKTLIKVSAESLEGKEYIKGIIFLRKLCSNTSPTFEELSNLLGVFLQNNHEFAFKVTNYSQQITQNYSYVEDSADNPIVAMSKCYGAADFVFPQSMQVKGGCFYNLEGFFDVLQDYNDLHVSGTKVELDF